MKGQANAITTVSAAIAVGVIVLVGLVVYGISQDVFPHDETFSNETMCTTCVNSTLYAFDNIPVVNDSTLLCFNASNDLMTRGINERTCLGYNTINLENINITNTSAENFCQISDVVCSYTQNNANNERQAFYTNVNSTIFSGFALAAVLVVILAAAIIITIVFFIRP